MNFCIANTPIARFLFRGAKYFACFSRFLSVKRQENELNKENKSPPHPLPPRFTPLGYSGVIRVKMFVLKHWVLLEDIGVLTNGNR